MTPLQVLEEGRAADEFERKLAECTKVPPERLGDYQEWSEDDVERELESTTGILKRFANAVIGAMDDPAHTNEFLRQLDLKAISRDHDWRAIFSALQQQGPEYDRHRHALLIKYLQYLSFRKKLLSYIYARKAGLDETHENWDPSLYLAPGAMEERAAQHASYVRLPLGEPLTVTLAHGERAELLLAGHLYRLSGLPAPALIDQNGVMYFLRAGRNLVGRHPENDIVVDADFRDVSRAHLIIEWSGAPQLILTDLSSKGTFVSADTLSKAGQRHPG